MRSIYCVRSAAARLSGRLALSKETSMFAIEIVDIAVFGRSFWPADGFRCLLVSPKLWWGRTRATTTTALY